MTEEVYHELGLGELDEFSPREEYRSKMMDNSQSTEIKQILQSLNNN
jgi:hypothetical protein